MNKTLQQLADRWEATAEEWRDILTSRKETYITCANQLREALSRCNLTAETEVKPSSFNEWWHGDAIKNDAPIFADAYDACEATWQACEKQMEAKIEELENWKRQALEVEAQLDAQRIAKLLGAKLGESCHAAINREVPKLVEELQRVRPLADRYQRVCDSLGIENGILGHIKSIRAELETLRTLLKRARVHMTNTRYNLPRIGMEEICADIDKLLSPPPDPFTTWKQRYLPNSSDDLAREAWEKAKGN